MESVSARVQYRYLSLRDEVTLNCAHTHCTVQLGTDVAHTFCEGKQATKQTSQAFTHMNTF